MDQADPCRSSGLVLTIHGIVCFFFLGCSGCEHLSQLEPLAEIWAWPISVLCFDALYSMCWSVPSQVLGFGWFVVLQDACLREPRTAASPFPSSSEDEEVGAAAASGGLSLSLPEGACTTGMLWLRDLAVVEGVENLFQHVGKAALQFGRVVLRSSPGDVGLPWGALGPGPKRGGG